MSEVKIGQRYMSLAEPELGLGTIIEVEGKLITLSYDHTQEVRQYGMQSAPLKRILFEIGEEVSSNEGIKFEVAQIETSESGLIVYIGKNENDLIIECDLADSMSFHRPEDKLLNANADKGSLFQLRYDTFKYKAWLTSLDVRGFLGGRLSLIKHQFYLADKICQRVYPRVLLADEVGLGKTIETGLILHRLILTGRAERVLIITPSSLNFQWFIEMLRKYNSIFSVVNDSENFEVNSNPFDENNLVITSMELLCESEVARKLLEKSNWDILVVDEAHKLDDVPKKELSEYSIIENLSKRINGLLLLSATPDINGSEGLFSHLKLIDPERFYDFKKYCDQENQFKEMAQKGRKLIVENGYDESNQEISDLIDRHGPGRVFFRNTREIIDKKHQFFPKRILKDYALDNSKVLNKEKSSEEIIYQIKIKWLVDFLNEYKDKKVLLICHSKKKVLRIEKDLNEQSIGNKVATFHEGLSLMGRDKKAAYFYDPEGANILVCSEIGSEGRNFQFCQNLILFDLPMVPDLLEQRIGRLDRIGQKKEIFIHLPYLNNSWEQILFQWYQQVFGLFSKSAKGCAEISKIYQDDIKNSLSLVQEYLTDDKLQNLIKKGKQSFDELNLKLQEGRDVLVELNSFNREIAEQITKKIVEVDKSNDLRNYLENVYSHFGVDVEDLDEYSQFIRPGDNMFISHFPYLTEDGFSYTYNRQVALEREDLVFMTWDHPMVTGILDLISGEENGNVTLMTRKNGQIKSFLEVFYLLDSIAPKSFEVGRFLPPTIIRVLIDLDGNNFSDKWDKEKLDGALHDAGMDIALKISKFSRKKLKDLLQHSKTLAIRDQERIITLALNSVENFYDKEIERLKYLLKINPVVSQKEVNDLIYKQTQIKKYIEEASLKIDSFRFIY